MFQQCRKNQANNNNKQGLLQHEFDLVLEYTFLIHIVFIALWIDIMSWLKIIQILCINFKNLICHFTGWKWYYVFRHISCSEVLRTITYIIWFFLEVCYIHDKNRANILLYQGSFIHPLKQKIKDACTYAFMLRSIANVYFHICARVQINVYGQIPFRLNLFI